MCIRFDRIPGFNATYAAELLQVAAVSHMRLFGQLHVL